MARSRQCLRRRSGIVAVLAMLYLMLFTVLAIGFYAASTMLLQVARNDRFAADAQAAAESGIEFAKVQFRNVSVADFTRNDDLLAGLATSLARSLNGTGNMNGHFVLVANHTIDLPSADDTIEIDPIAGTAFRLQIATEGDCVMVKSVGWIQKSSIRRAIRICFQLVRHGPQLALEPIAGSYEEVTP